MSENSNGNYLPDDELDEQEQPQPAVTAPPEKVHIPECRSSYPLWWALVLGTILTVCWLFASVGLLLRPVAIIVGEVAVICFAALWRYFSNKTLQNRIPPPGWKSHIMPGRLENLTLEEFDGMRFVLKGDDEDDIEEHRVRWVMRYSKDRLFLSWVLVVLAPLCVVGHFVFPTITTSGSGAELPQIHNLREIWIIAAPVLLFAAWIIRLGWNYERQMLDESQLYFLRPNPAWLPLLPGKNDIIPLFEILKADPVDTGWGQFWGHGTVELFYQQGYGNVQKKTLRRVPNHHGYCNAVNAMKQKGGMGYGMGMGMGMNMGMM
jgi:hypothetical protein